VFAERSCKTTHDNARDVNEARLAGARSARILARFPAIKLTPPSTRASDCSGFRCSLDAERASVHIEAPIFRERSTAFERRELPARESRSGRFQGCSMPVFTSGLETRCILVESHGFPNENRERDDLLKKQKMSSVCPIIFEEKRCVGVKARSLRVAYDKCKCPWVDEVIRVDSC